MATTDNNSNDKPDDKPKNIILSYSPKELVALSNALALALAECQSSDAINAWGNVLMTAGQILQTIGNQMDAQKN